MHGVIERAALRLPVRAALPELDAALADRGTAVLVAPPGTGKTTLVPLALAGSVAGRVVVAEPRRVAARAAARRVAALLGEPVGGSVGFSVRGESRRSDATRVEVVTTGLLVRRLQPDPELPASPRWCSTSATNGSWTPTWRSPSAWTSGRRCGPSCSCWRCRRARR